MATKVMAAPKNDAPELVQLKCEKLGIKSQDFTPAHAKALLDFQQAKGLKPEDCWQPVGETPAPTE